MDNTAHKLKITSVVVKWERDNPMTYQLFLEGRKQKTANLKNAFAVPDGAGYIERLLHDIPEDLDIALTQQLDESDLQFFRSKLGAQWFAKSFKQYNVSQKT